MSWEDQYAYPVDEDDLGDDIESGIWQTKDGRRIQIKDMSDEHLTNTIRYLERRISDLEDATATGYSFRGDMAQYYGEQEADKAFAVLGWCENWRKVMKAENERRG